MYVHCQGVFNTNQAQPRIKLASSDYGFQMVYFYTRNFIGMYILDGLGMENVAIFYGHLEYFTTVWYIIWHFGIFCSD
jgi:hypothetical protein